MSSNAISPEDTDLLLHRFVTERMPLLVWFATAGGSVQFKIEGFLTSANRATGLYIATNLDDPIHAYMIFRNLSGTIWEYADETELPKDFDFSLGLHVTFSNGDSLMLAEKRTL